MLPIEAQCLLLHIIEPTTSDRHLMLAGVTPAKKMASQTIIHSIIHCAAGPLHSSVCPLLWEPQGSIMSKHK